MGWLYLPKTTPTAGQKGFLCGDVFVPIEMEVPSVYKKGVVIPMETTSAPVPSEGLILNFPCTSNTAETGQEFTAKGAVYKDDSAYFSGSSTGIISNKKASELFAEITEQISFCCSFNTYDTTKGQEILSCTEFGGFSVGINSDRQSGAFQISLYAGGSYAGYKAFDVSGNILPNTWYFCCVTYDGSNIKVYLNSELKSTVAKSGQIKFPSNSATFIIGAEPLGSGSIDGDCFFGEISNVLVYNRALTEDEVLFLNNKFSKKQIFIPLEEVQPEEGAEFEKNSEEMPSEGLILNVPLAQSATEDELGNEISETGNVTFTTVEGIQCANISDTSAVGGTHILINAPALSSSGAVPVSFSFWASAYEIPLSKDEFFYYGHRNENNDPDYESIFVGVSKNNRFVTNFGESNSNAYPGFHHIAYMCTGTKTLFYVDGVLQFSDNRVWDYGGNTPISLSGGYFAGFRMYNRALSETEIRKLAREWKKPIPNPEANTSGILINSKNEIAFLKKTSAEMPVDGLVLNFPCTSSTAETGQQFQAKNVELKKRDDSAYFPGEKSGIISTVSASELLASATSAISFSAWFNTSDTGKAQEIISCTETGGFSVGLNSDSNSGYCHIYLRAGSLYANYNAFEISGNILKNTWYFICVIYNGSNIKTYLNSTLKNTKSKTGTLAYPANDTPLTIGAEAKASGGVSTDTFQGYIAGVRIYNRALTEEEVATLNTEFSVQKINKIFIPIIGENNAGA